MSARERPLHLSWLHGPEDRPDPRVGDRSLSAASRDEPGPPRVPWDGWLNQPIRETNEGAA